mmetsp:Transcript_55471/g.162022  ORF Transcript_55471/g.162022 Transcript_55471/m.162022 type:complete len:192 (-) Transcript_55471:63-638(-)
MADYMAAHSPAILQEASALRSQPPRLLPHRACLTTATLLAIVCSPVAVTASSEASAVAAEGGDTSSAAGSSAASGAEPSALSPGDKNGPAADGSAGPNGGRWPGPWYWPYEGNVRNTLIYVFGFMTAFGLAGDSWIGYQARKRRKLVEAKKKNKRTGASGENVLADSASGMRARRQATGGHGEDPVDWSSQ